MSGRARGPRYIVWPISKVVLRQDSERRLFSLVGAACRAASCPGLGDLTSSADPESVDTPDFGSGRRGFESLRRVDLFRTTLLQFRWPAFRFCSGPTDERGLRRGLLALCDPARSGRWMLASPPTGTRTCEGRAWRPMGTTTGAPVAARSESDIDTGGSLQLVERYKTGLRTWDEHRVTVGPRSASAVKRRRSPTRRTGHITRMFRERQGGRASRRAGATRSRTGSSATASRPCPPAAAPARDRQRLRCGVRCAASDDEAERRRLPGRR